MHHRSPLPPPLPAPQNERELLLRASALAGHTVGTLAAALGVPLPSRSAAAKGFVGQLVEVALGADRDAGERPDFVRLGIELKTVPIRIARAGGQPGPTAPQPAPQLVPQASTFVCSIGAQVAQDACWTTSRLRRRLAAVLLLPVTAAAHAPLAERKLYAPRLWRPTPAQWQQLRADWEDLLGAIAAGRGMSLTAREGVALQVRPKAAHSGVRTLGQLGDGFGDVLPQGFYLRQRFMAEVLAS